MRRPHLLLRVLFFSGWIASWSPTHAAGPADAHLFPAPNRPVATIITPAYSDAKTRDRRGEAERVMNRVGIRPGMRVADIGAGDGYYTVRLARRLGSTATIYAEDVKAEYLARLASRLNREGIFGVTLIRGDPSTDGGASWSPVWFIDLDFYGEYCDPCGGVLALAIDPLIPTTLFGGMAAYTAWWYDGGVAYEASALVFKSTDGGASWSARVLIDVNSALAIDPLTPTTLYAGGDGVYKSADGGASWNAIGLTGVGGLWALAIDP